MKRPQPANAMFQDILICQDKVWPVSLAPLQNFVLNSFTQLRRSKLPTSIREKGVTNHTLPLLDSCQPLPLLLILQVHHQDFLHRDLESILRLSDFFCMMCDDVRARVLLPVFVFLYVGFLFS